MKQLSFLLLISTFILSCSGDAETVEGTWELNSYTISCQGESDIILNASDGCVSLEGEQICFTFIFDGDMTITSVVDGENFLGTYSENNGVIEICDGSECNNATQNGDTLLVTISEEECDITLNMTR